jgi:signal transduction histidine kinase/ligand-binding sensor domain-containing protein
VNCILHDSKGLMWFGTNDGLNRYDGYAFTVYKHDPDDPHSLSHNRVWSLYEDASGALWVGTYGGGLNRFDRGLEQFTRYDAGDFGNVTDEPVEFRNTIAAIAEHPTGVLWIATYGGGLVRLELSTEQFTSYAPDPRDQALGGHEWVTALLVDRSGMLWIGTHSEGLDRFDPATGQITSYHHEPSDPASLGHDWIRAIVEDESGVLWIATYGGGLDRYDPATETFSHYRHDPDDTEGLRRSPSEDTIWTMYEGPSGRLWIGTYSGGLDAFDRERKTFSHYRSDPNDLNSLSGDQIRAVYEAPSGVLWVGVQGGGVSKADPASGQFAHWRGDPDDPQRPSNYPVRALYEAPSGVLWVGTAGGGLDALNRETGQWRHYRQRPDDPQVLGPDWVRAIHEDRSGVLWIGTNGGLYQFDRISEQFTRMPHDPPDRGNVKRNTINAIHEDREGVLWFATYGRGLSEWDPDAGHFVYHQGGGPGSLSSNFVQHVYEDRAGVLWVGTDVGLNYLDRETGRWRSYQHDPEDRSSLSHNWVQVVQQTQDGALWIGTLGGGVNRLDRASGTFTRYGAKDGLASDLVTQILPDNRGHLWFGTANGLSRYDPQSGTFRTYGADRGLPVNEFDAAFASPGGEMFFGGSGGFLAFYPGQIASNPHPPAIVLTSLQQRGMDLDTGVAPENITQIALRWPDNTFEFSFAALSYSRPEGNQHAYTLEGFDSGWIYGRTGRYTNLPGGTYTLRLIGSNDDGVWNKEGVSIQVTVVPPLWGRWWFWGIAALIGAGGAYGGYRLRVRSLEARGRELERRVEEEIEQRLQVEEALRESETERAVAAERSRLARELHDAVTQTLFSASLLAEALPTLWERNREMGREHLAMLRQMSRGALAEMRSLLLELRPAALVESSLEDLLQQLGEAVTGRAGVPVSVEAEGRCELPADLHVALYRIAQEALNNVVKHAQARQVVVRLCCTPLTGSICHPERSTAESKGDNSAAAVGTVELTIRDDGRGFDPGEVSAEHMGLGIMRERAEAVGAQLEIESRPGEGTRVTVVKTCSDDFPVTAAS